jgi:hypothetical protein
MAKKEGSGGIHHMDSGLIHTADSLAGGREGTFVDRFGPPGDPTRKSSSAHDRGTIGRQPDLLRGIAGQKQKGRQ